MSAPAPPSALGPVPAGLVRAGDAQTAAIDLGDGIDIALGAEPTNLAALKIKRVALDHLLVASGGSNLSETMWLKSELAALDAAPEAQGQNVA